MSDPPSQALRRIPDKGMVAGVCAGLGERFAVDPLLFRISFCVGALVTGGFGAVVYLFAWLALPSAPVGPGTRPAERLARGADWRVAAGAGCLTLSALLVFRELGIWWSDAVIWPLILASSGAVLLWRMSRTAPEPSTSGSTPAPPAARRRSGLINLSRGGFGVALVIGAVLLFLSANGVLDAPRDAVLATLAGVAALALILAPFLWRLGRNLAHERAERIRSQERAELAAHVHDSVLQTLTLMQKRADDPREVAALARRQERELRGWLFGRDGRADVTGLAGSIEAVAAEVEDAYGTPVDVVTVGDRPADERGEALVAATREAMTNAAKFAADAGPVAVYAEFSPDGAQVFVRDRGGGFELGSVPADRRGVRESIIGRMQRHGGTATVRSSATEGTEVELSMTEPSR